MSATKRGLQHMSGPQFGGENNCCFHMSHVKSTECHGFLELITRLDVDFFFLYLEKDVVKPRQMCYLCFICCV